MIAPRPVYNDDALPALREFHTHHPAVVSRNAETLTRLLYAFRFLAYSLTRSRSRRHWRRCAPKAR